MTAASGSCLLARWVAHGGMRRARSRSAGLPPAVILGHFGLAIAGLAVWIGYLLSTAAALAWIALGFLLPVVGLGIATLVLSVPETAATSATPIAAPAGPARTPMPVLVIAAHGVLAIATLLLVLLAAVAAR
jgi:manganese efflux pump family protein